MFKKGQVALITGAGPGMGRSIALGFARHGVDVAISARGLPKVEAIANEIRALNRDPLVFCADITDRDRCQNLVDATVERFGRLDFLIQNGYDVGDWREAIDADLDRWRQVFEVNFFGALNMAQAAVPEIKKSGGGAIVFVNTGGAVKVPPRMGAYSASKLALASLTRTLAMELGASNVRVNGIYLGSIEGETTHGAADKSAAAAGLSKEEWYKKRYADCILNGVMPTPDQCAGTVLYLCSDLAEPVTGQHVSVNNGQWIL